MLISDSDKKVRSFSQRKAKFIRLDKSTETMEINIFRRPLRNWIGLIMSDKSSMASTVTMLFQKTRYYMDGGKMITGSSQPFKEKPIYLHLKPSKYLSTPLTAQILFLEMAQHFFSVLNL